MTAFASSPHPNLRQHHKLTARETELVCLLAGGNDLQQCAATLGLTYSSARTYLDRIYAKTGTHRQAELVRLVLVAPVWG